MLQTLQRNAFETIQKDGKKILCLKNFSRSYALVIFTGNNCQHCVKMMDVVNKVMPNFENKLHFLTINLSENEEVHKDSIGTATNITYVPFVILYADNLPYKIFEGDYNEIEFQQFLNFVIEPKRTQLISKPQQIIKQEEYTEQSSNCSGGYCYKTFEDAYNG